MATETPLLRLENARIEWRVKRRELLAQGRITPLIAATVEFVDLLLADQAIMADSVRMVLTILGSKTGVYSDQVARRFEEIEARKEMRRTA